MRCCGFCVSAALLITFSLSSANSGHCCWISLVFVEQILAWVAYFYYSYTFYHLELYEAGAGLRAAMWL